jgi:hypothetical protein
MAEQVGVRLRQVHRIRAPLTGRFQCNGAQHTALIRITNTSFPSAIDTSNAVFTIKAPITVDYPNTNMDTLTSCSTINIQWSKSTALENYT